jgi:gamma-glutamyltranspeptidase/glutathione hydrolase
VAAVRRHGGCLDLVDLDEHQTPCPVPLTASWGGALVHVQPPMSQGVLLAMALRKVESLWAEGVRVDDHLLVEVTGAAFAHRSSCRRGRRLLEIDLDVDPDRASGLTGPRAYLHTAGVATVDRHGQVVSSLVSVFDDFGSGVLVPELGIVLNNRAAGFTDGDNSPAPGRRPVHTLAPAMVVSPDGVLALATPGADGQVQSLLQVLSASRAGTDLPGAVTAPRWRSQDGDLLLETGHPSRDALVSRGHRVVETPAGAEVFGAVVAAGTSPAPHAVADWRRLTDARGAP